jgi:hypothetical protein
MATNYVRDGKENIQQCRPMMSAHGRVAKYFTSLLQGHGSVDISDYFDPNMTGLHGRLPTIQNISIGLANLTATLFWLTTCNNQFDVPVDLYTPWPLGSVISARQAVILNHLHVRLD